MQRRDKTGVNVPIEKSDLHGEFEVDDKYKKPDDLDAAEFKRIRDDYKPKNHNRLTLDQLHNSLPKPPNFCSPPGGCFE